MSRPTGLTRFYLGYVLSVLVITALVGVQVSRRVQHDALHGFEERLRGNALLLREIALPVLSGERSASELQGRVTELGRQVGVRFTVIKSDGVVLADSREHPSRMDNHGEREEVVLARDRGWGQATRYSHTLDQDMSYYALPVEHRGLLVGYVRTAFPQTEVRAYLRSVRGVILLGALVLGGLSLLIGLYIVRGAMAPLSRRTRAAETVAAEDRGRLTAILSGMTEGVVAVDASQQIVHVNDAAGRLFEIVPEEVVSVPAWKILRQKEVMECLERVLRSGSEQSIDFELESMDGLDRFQLELLAAPLKAERGSRAGGAVLVFHDVTRLRHLESVRQDFVANVSHEIKTPLAAAQGMIETMIDDPSMEEETQARFLERIQNQLQRMGNLVTDLLALSRHEGGELPWAEEEVDFRQPALDAVEQFQPYAQSKSLELSADVPLEPIHVEANAESLRQVFDNLLSNAIRYTPENGKIEVRVTREGAHAVAEVQDSGIGIESKHLGRIFERFYRVDKARSRELGGTGLGLSIVKHIVAGMRGGVSVQSRPGVGTTFRIHLPLAPDGLDNSSEDPENDTSPLP